MQRTNENPVAVNVFCSRPVSGFPTFSSRMSGRGFDALQKHFAPLQIQADERDARFLAGGNFFGREGER